jgi:4-amino-4-deoxy-L-arabinose transferase-like glycosyltransferase
VTTARVEGRTDAGQDAWALARDHLIYLAIIAAYCFPYLSERDLFFRDESRFGGIATEMIRNDAWFTLTISGEYYLEKPPLFFTLLRFAIEVAGSAAPWVFYSVVALTAFFFVAASDAFLGKAGFDRRTVRSANLLLLAVPWIAIHMQVLRMDLLFSGLILFSVVSYIRGVERPDANGWPLLGGLLAGLAVLVKGPFGALIPLVTVVAFLTATRRARLLLRADMLWSIAAIVLPILAWLISLYATFGNRAIKDLFADQIIERAIHGRHSHRPWWLYPLSLAWTAMPWLLLIPVLLVARIRLAVLGAFSGDPVSPSPGWRLVIAYFVATIVILSVVAQRHLHFLLPAIPGLMVVVAIFYARLDEAAPRLLDWFYVILAVTVLVAPPLTIWAIGFLTEKEQVGLATYVGPETLRAASGALALTAIPLALAARMRGEARLYAGIASVAIMIFSLKAIALPDLDRVYSPRHAATAFEQLVPSGDPIVVYRFYWGSLSYHFDRPLIYVETPGELQERLASEPRLDFVIATDGDWARDRILRDGFTKVGDGRLETTRFVLLRRNGLDQ